MSISSQVLQLMGTTGIFEDDHQSRQVAAKALEATVPAWVHAGKGIEQLWQTAMTVLPAAHPLHRIPILESILKPMPQVRASDYSGALICPNSVLCILGILSPDVV